MSQGAGFLRSDPRRAKGFLGRLRIAGSSMCPARWSPSMRPRHTMSRRAPLGCRQFHASQSFFESSRRLALGCSAINCRMKVMSASVMFHPRCRSFASMRTTVADSILERNPYLKDIPFFLNSRAYPAPNGCGLSCGRIAAGKQDL